MNIVIIGSAHPLRGGGISTFNERLAEVLQQQGHDVSIYSFSLQYPSFLFPGKSQFTNEPAPKNLLIYSVINSINPLNWIKTGTRIKKNNPDLVIVRYWLPFMGPCLGTILRRVKKNKHTRILCIADNIIPHEKRIGDMAFTRYFLKPVDTFLTMSKDVLKDLKTLTRKTANYHPHPLYDNYGPAISKDEACRALGLNTQNKHILFFGFIRKYKGLDLLLEALNIIKANTLNIKLVIAGEFYDDKAYYEELIAKYQLQNLVVMFTSFIPNNEIKNYFCAADLVVQPYRTATQSGITQIAFHFEKPIVVTDVGGLAELVPDNKCGYVVKPVPASIADAIIKFYTDGPIDRFEENIKTEKTKYSWDSFTQSLLKTAFNN
jgi:glycosyltransferase involved in cell wall biosynthesis